MLVLGWRALSLLSHVQADAAFAMERGEHYAELTQLVREDGDGRLSVREQLSDPRFLVERSGYYWEIQTANGQTLRSPSLGGGDLPFDVGFGALKAGSTKEALGPTGTAQIYEDTIPLPSGRMARVGVATDLRLTKPLVKDFEAATHRILLFVALGLLVTMVGQAYVGFLPLSRLQREVERIKRGEIKRLAEDFPSELRPTVASLNGLLQANEAHVERSRILAGNLAHSLKTPLSIIVDEATKMSDQPGGGDPAVILRKSERIRGIVDFQLARIRASSGDALGAARLPLAASVENVLRALIRLHPDREISVEGLNPGVQIACERQDFEEMFANLVDNAMKWAKSTVRIAVRQDASCVEIAVEDDGPGMPEADLARVFEVGLRLDESIAGSGFGLAIVRELAETGGGSVRLTSSALGGVCARLLLPSGA